MIVKTAEVQTVDEVIAFCNEYNLSELAEKASAILVQVYTSNTTPKNITPLIAPLKACMSKAIIVCASTNGEISDGNVVMEKTVIAVMFFEKTRLRSIFIEAKYIDEVECGRQLLEQISQLDKETKGLLMLSTPNFLNVSDVVSMLDSVGLPYPLFGGGATDYTTVTTSLIMHGDSFTNKGVVAVAFIGDAVQIDLHAHLGWHTISKEMVVTDSVGFHVKTVDNIPAYNIYRRYLDIDNDEDFFNNALEFPFIVEKNGESYARTPVSVSAEDGVIFAGTVPVGSKIRIGYGDPMYIIEEAKEIQNKLDQFAPDIILLFDCMCRRYLLQEDTKLETLPFQKIAPTVGFYTYGEYFGDCKSVSVLNSTLVAVGIKEVLGDEDVIDRSKHFCEETGTCVLDLHPDQLAVKHSKIISKLVHFMRAVSEDLEAAKKTAVRLSETDFLTNIYTRSKAVETMQTEILKQTPFSIALMDLDKFKSVNDTYGHDVGDSVLVEFVKLVQSVIRSTDVFCRWGGEEFLLILLGASGDTAFRVADKIRQTVEQHHFQTAGTVTVSMGLKSYEIGTTIETILKSVDESLYEAKHRGRNQVVKSK